jgi:hypothetical protein
MYKEKLRKQIEKEELRNISAQTLTLKNDGELLVVEGTYHLHPKANNVDRCSVDSCEMKATHHCIVCVEDKFCAGCYKFQRTDIVKFYRYLKYCDRCKSPHHTRSGTTVDYGGDQRSQCDDCTLSGRYRIDARFVLKREPWRNKGIDRELIIVELTAQTSEDAKREYDSNFDKFIHRDLDLNKRFGTSVSSKKNPYMSDKLAIDRAVQLEHSLKVGIACEGIESIGRKKTSSLQRSSHSSHEMPKEFEGVSRLIVRGRLLSRPFHVSLMSNLTSCIRIVLTCTILGALIALNK